MDDQHHTGSAGLRPWTRLLTGVIAVVLGGVAVTAVDRPAEKTSAVPAPDPGPCAGAPAGPLTPAAERPYPLPAGWSWHADPAGFRLAVPLGWNRSADGTVVCFRDPGATRLLTVGPAGEPLTGRRTTLPGYRRVQTGGADAEYTWHPPGGTAQRARHTTLSTADGAGFVVSLTTRDTDWPLGEPVLRHALASLR